MNIVFIWFGLVEPLYIWRDMCIKRAKEIYPDATFKCITTLKDFYGMEIIDAYKVIEEMEEGGYYCDIANFLALSDEMRFYWLSKNKNTLYLDTDTWCKEAMNISIVAGKAGIEALWSGNESKPFSDILSIRTKGDLFVTLADKVEANDLSKYFEHKPLWAQDLRSHRPHEEKANELIKTYNEDYKQCEKRMEQLQAQMIAITSLMGWDTKKINEKIGSTMFIAND